MVVTEVRHLKSGDSLPPLKEGLRLYSMRFCPFSQRAHLVLDTKKIKYETVNINLANKPDWYFDKNPGGSVPTIEYSNGDILYESLIAADFIDEKYPDPPLYPKDPLEKAKDRLLIEKFSNTVIASIHKMFVNNYTADKESMEKLLAGFDIIEKELGKRKTKFLGGSRPGMVDLMIWPWCERCHKLEVITDDDAFKIPLERFQKVSEWHSNMMADEAVKASHVDPKILAEHYKTRKAGNPNYDLLLKTK